MKKVVFCFFVLLQGRMWSAEGSAELVNVIEARLAEERRQQEIEQDRLKKERADEEAAQARLIEAQQVAAKAASKDQAAAAQATVAADEVALNTVKDQVQKDEAVEDRYTQEVVTDTQAAAIAQSKAEGQGGLPGTDPASQAAVLAQAQTTMAQKLAPMQAASEQLVAHMETLQKQLGLSTSTVADKEVIEALITDCINMANEIRKFKADHVKAVRSMREIYGADGSLGSVNSGVVTVMVGYDQIYREPQNVYLSNLNDLVTFFRQILSLFKKTSAVLANKIDPTYEQRRDLTFYSLGIFPGVCEAKGVRDYFAQQANEILKKIPSSKESDQVIFTGPDKIATPLSLARAKQQVSDYLISLRAAGDVIQQKNQILQQLLGTSPFTAELVAQVVAQYSDLWASINAFKGRYPDVMTMDKRYSNYISSPLTLLIRSCKEVYSDATSVQYYNFLIESLAKRQAFFDTMANALENNTSVSQADISTLEAYAYRSGYGLYGGESKALTDYLSNTALDLYTRLSARPVVEDPAVIARRINDEIVQQSTSMNQKAVILQARFKDLKALLETTVFTDDHFSALVLQYSTFKADIERFGQTYVQVMGVLRDNYSVDVYPVLAPYLQVFDTTSQILLNNPFPDIVAINNLFTLARGAIETSSPLNFTDFFSLVKYVREGVAEAPVGFSEYVKETGLDLLTRLQPDEIEEEEIDSQPSIDSEHPDAALIHPFDPATTVEHIKSQISILLSDEDTYTTFQKFGAMYVEVEKLLSAWQECQSLSYQLPPNDYFLIQQLRKVLDILSKINLFQLRNDLVSGLFGVSSPFRTTWFNKLFGKSSAIGGVIDPFGNVISFNERDRLNVSLSMLRSQLFDAGLQDFLFMNTPFSDVLQDALHGKVFDLLKNFSWVAYGVKDPDVLTFITAYHAYEDDPSDVHKLSAQEALIVLKTKEITYGKLKKSTSVPIPIDPSVDPIDQNWISVEGVVSAALQQVLTRAQTTFNLIKNLSAQLAVHPDSVDSVMLAQRLFDSLQTFKDKVPRVFLENYFFKTDIPALELLLGSTINRERIAIVNSLKALFESHQLYPTQGVLTDAFKQAARVILTPRSSDGMEADFSAFLTQALQLIDQGDGEGLFTLLEHEDSVLAQDRIAADYDAEIQELQESDPVVAQAFAANPKQDPLVAAQVIIPYLEIDYMIAVFSDFNGQQRADLKSHNLLLYDGLMFGQSIRSLCAEIQAYVVDLRTGTAIGADTETKISSLLATAKDLERSYLDDLKSSQDVQGAFDLYEKLAPVYQELDDAKVSLEQEKSVTVTRPDSAFFEQVDIELQGMDELLGGSSTRSAWLPKDLNNQDMQDFVENPQEYVETHFAFVKKRLTDLWNRGADGSAIPIKDFAARITALQPKAEAGELTVEDQALIAEAQQSLKDVQDALVQYRELSAIGTMLGSVDSIHLVFEEGSDGQALDNQKIIRWIAQVLSVPGDVLLPMNNLFSVKRELLLSRLQSTGKTTGVNMDQKYRDLAHTLDTDFTWALEVAKLHNYSVSIDTQKVEEFCSTQFVDPTLVSIIGSLQEKSFALNRALQSIQAVLSTQKVQ